jgi:hypothetical protein
MLIAAFTQQNAPSSPLQRQNGKPQSARAESEDDLVKKRSYGGSCDLRLNPSRNSVPECETPWPRSIPAFETCFLLVYYFRCRARYERFKNPACHTCSRRFFFYTTRRARAQGEVGDYGALFVRCSVEPGFRGCQRDSGRRHSSTFQTHLARSQLLSIRIRTRASFAAVDHPVP